MKLTRTYIRDNEPINETLPEGRYLNVGEYITPGDLYLSFYAPYSLAHCIGDAVTDGPYVGNYFRPQRRTNA